MTAFLIILVFFGWWVLWRFEASFYDPAVWWQAGWTIMLAAHMLIPLDYFYPSLTLRSTLLIAACLVGYPAFWLVGRQTVRRTASKPIVAALIIPKEVVLLLIGGVALYCVCILIVLPGRLQAVPSGWGGLLGDLRQAHWDEFEGGEKSWIMAVTSVTRPFSVLAAMSLPFLIRSRILLALGSVLAALTLFMESLTTGGRFVACMVAFLMVYTAIGVIIANHGMNSSVVVLHRIFSFRAKVLLAVLVVVAFVITALFPYLRNPDVDTNVDQYIRFLYCASVSNDHIGTLGRTLIYGLGYVGDPVAKLTFFLEHTNIDQWYANGMYSFPVVMGPINNAFGESISWLDLRRAIAAELIQANFPTNPWSTGVRDLIVDFGMGGATVATCVFGFISGIWGYYVDAFRNYFTICISSICSLWMLLMAFINISMIGPAFNTLLLISCLFLVFRVGGTGTR